MRVEYLRAHYALLFCRNVNQPENTAVWCAIDNREFSEILVQRDKNTFFGIGSGENILVSGIFLPVAHPNGIMPGDLQIRNRPAPNTSVEKEFHPSLVAKNGSTRSCPTRRRA